MQLIFRIRTQSRHCQDSAVAQIGRRCALVHVSPLVINIAICTAVRRVSRSKRTQTRAAHTKPLHALHNSKPPYRHTRMEEGEDQDNLAQEGDAAIEGEADPTATEKKRGGRRNLNKVWDAGDTKGLSKCAFCNQLYTTGNGHGCVAKSCRKEREDELEYQDVDTVTRKMYLSRLLDITVKAPQATFFVKWILARVDGQHRILWLQRDSFTP
ncbi:hypothetical protein V1527DRAFT_265082 [Lipomyces starkeyi]